MIITITNMIKIMVMFIIMGLIHTATIRKKKRKMVKSMATTSMLKVHSSTY
jgi:hypothetical protein